MLYLQRNHQRFVEYLEELARTPLIETARQEAKRLRPIFKAAQQILDLPKQHASFQEFSIETDKPINLEEVYINSALAFRSMAINAPFLTNDALPKSIDIESAAATLNNYNITGLFSPKLFDTAKYGVGMYRVNPENQKDHPASKNILIGKIHLPHSFILALEIFDHKELFDHITALANLVSHDWWHSITVEIANKDFRKCPETSLMHKPSKFSEARRQGLLDGNDIVLKAQNTLCMWVPNSEVWSLRLQAEILQEMAKEPGNPLTKSIQDYLESWKAFAEKSKGAQKAEDTELTPAAYGVKILAFFLMRALPYDHPVVQEILQMPEIEPYRNAFESVYNDGSYGWIFGNGRHADRNQCSEWLNNSVTKETFRKAVLDITRHSIALIDESTREALALAGEDSALAIA